MDVKGYWPLKKDNLPFAVCLSSEKSHAKLGEFNLLCFKLICSCQGSSLKWSVKSLVYDLYGSVK